ncbi:hypothetical protein [Modestobacter excelsi]|uniref:hypothetical protein n=1 Tax=Modestobacter excelsi TaxID=2213161 RepID=UPI00110D122D|nr:hypothetical protein [Modestobacter excelsi]
MWALWGAGGLLAASVLSLFWTVNVERSGATDRTTVLLASDLVTATVGGSKINERGVLYSLDTREATIRQDGCFDQVELDDDEFPLRHNVLVLDIDHVIVCVEAGTIKRVDNLRLAAGNLDVQPNNGAGAIGIVDPQDPTKGSGIVRFRELQYWTVPSEFEIGKTVAASLMGGFAGGFLTNAAYGAWTARRSQGAIKDEETSADTSTSKSTDTRTVS